MKVLVNSSPLSLWQNVIQEAQYICSTELQKDLELYLISLLMRYMNKPEFVCQAVAPQLLQGLNTNESKHREPLLQKVGDSCLLLSGLFPNHADKRLVKLSYFIKIGQGAYIAISKTSNDIYSLLAQQFVSIMDILQSIRQYAKEIPDLLPLQAYDLWNETGSQRAFRILKQYSQATPATTHPQNDDLRLIKIKK
jgi:hypothetical protein